MKRRSLSNPVRNTESNRRTTQVLKIRGSVEGSHIPRPRIRSLSTDRLSGRKSTLKLTGKASLGHHAPTTPKTPSYSRSNVLSMSTSRTGRSPSAERASILAAKVPRKDSRPITDKAFQTQMIKKIDNYFYSIKQSSMLNTSGSIKPLTIKMFVDASGLLVRLLGVKHTLNNVNYVEEMPKLAKKFQYPGQMSKAWLKTANAMHAFPNALAWLSWLVEICEIRDIALEQFSLENLPFSNSDDQAEKNRNLFFSMLSFYNAWNENSGQEEILVAEFLKSEETRYDVSDETFEHARLDYENAMQVLEKEGELRNKVDIENKQSQDIIPDLMKDIESVDEYTLELDGHTQTLSAEIQNINSDGCVLDSDMQKHYEKQKELKAIIIEQPISPRERDEIVGKCEDIRKYLKQFETHLQEIQKDIYFRDMKLASANHSLTKTILEYNRDIHNYLDAISGVNVLEIQIPENVSSPHSMEMLQEISSALTKLKEKMLKELEEVEVVIKPNKMDLVNLQEKVKTLTDNSAELAKKFQEKEAKINQTKAQGKTEEAEIRENLKKLEQKIKSIQESQRDLESIENELGERIDKTEALKRQKQFYEKRAYNFYDKLYAILGSYRRERSAILDRIKKN